MSSKTKLQETPIEERAKARDNLARQIGALLARHWLCAQMPKDETADNVADVELRKSAIDQTAADEF